MTQRSLPTPQRNISRRGVIAGAAGLALLAACGKDTTSSTATTKGPRLTLVPRFDVNDFAVVGAPQRLVVSLLDSRKEAPRDLPPSMAFTFAKDGKPVGGPIRATLHGEDIDTPYYPVAFTPTEEGNFTIAAALDRATDPSTFRVQAMSAMPLIQPGDKLPIVDTPTSSDARGVDPVCTKSSGPCPYHEMNLRDSLVSGRPTALLISTPRFCQMHVCGPVLQILVEQEGKYPMLDLIHAEVYKQPLASNVPSARGLAPAVEALGLNYEPSLFLVASDGTVRERLDYVFDQSELTGALDRLTGRQ